MIRTCWLLVAAIAAVLWMGTGSSRADDETFKLDLRKGKEAATTNLLSNGKEAETVLVGGHGGHGGGGHVHGGSVHAAHVHGGSVHAAHFHGSNVHAAHFHGGNVHAAHFHNGHFHDGHFHNGHFHNGHFHNGWPFVSVGLGFGYWPRYYYPYYYGGYYYPSYYYTSYAYDHDPLLYYYPENVYVVPNGSSIRSIMPPATGPEETLPVPQRVPNDGTYPYDGGPANPVPIPQADPAPNRKAGSTPAPDARVVGIESKTLKYSYQAYGDKPAARKASQDRQLAARPAK